MAVTGDIMSHVALRSHTHMADICYVEQQFYIRLYINGIPKPAIPREMNFLCIYIYIYSFYGLIDTSIYRWKNTNSLEYLHSKRFWAFDQCTISTSKPNALWSCSIAHTQCPKMDDVFITASKNKIETSKWKRQPEFCHLTKRFMMTITWSTNFKWWSCPIPKQQTHKRLLTSFPRTSPRIVVINSDLEQ